MEHQDPEIWFNRRRGSAAHQEQEQRQQQHQQSDHKTCSDVWFNSRGGGGAPKEEHKGNEFLRYHRVKFAANNGIDQQNVNCCPSMTLNTSAEYIRPAGAFQYNPKHPIHSGRSQAAPPRRGPGSVCVNLNQSVQSHTATPATSQAHSPATSSQECSTAASSPVLSEAAVLKHDKLVRSKVGSKAAPSVSCASSMFSSRPPSRAQVFMSNGRPVPAFNPLGRRKDATVSGKITEK